MDFNIGNNNNGQIVSKDFYYSSNGNRNMGLDILDQSNKEFGFSLVDNIELMVMSRIGTSIPDLQSKITNSNVRMNALSELKTTLNAFNSNTIKPLNSRNSLTSYTVSNTDPSSVDVTVSSESISGNTSLKLNVLQVAQSKTLSISETTADQSFDAGVVSFTYGEYKDGSFKENRDLNEINVKIDDGDTIDDISNKINSSRSGIETSVVVGDDGLKELVIISKETGGRSDIKVTSTNQSLSSFNYNGENTDNIKEVQSAQNAVYQINGATMISESNSVKNVFGVDIFIKNISSGDIHINTKANPEGVVANISVFIENYNEVINRINDLNSDFSGEDYIGSLNGTPIGKEVEEQFSKIFANLSEKGISLSDIGITKTEEGTLDVNMATLNSYAATNPEDLYSMFASETKTSNKGITVNDYGNLGEGDHDIVVDRVAEVANLKSEFEISDVVLTEDKVLEIKINNKETISVTIEAGTYNAQDISYKINNELKSNNINDFNATSENGILELESKTTGSAKSIEIISGIDELGIVADGRHSGVDVAGTINGKRFLGDGDRLRSLTGDFAGVDITFNSNYISLNKAEEINVREGILNQFDVAVDNLTNAKSGTITEHLKELRDSLSEGTTKSLLDELASLEEKEQKYYQIYYNQYSAISAQLANLSNVSDMLDAMYFQNEK